jgi:GNAT superfamily N-acetyltransferase
MDIRIANTDAEIEACFPVLKELRPDIHKDDFIRKIRNLQKSGYVLAYIEVAGMPVAAAGFRLGESLAWKRYLYVDDLVTLQTERSKGYGAALMTWLTDYALREGCEQLHLDSGVQRKNAHRFYEREGMKLPSYHFAKYVASDAAHEK